MQERDFDAQLTALFDQPQSLDDEPAFLRELETRLARQLQRRRWFLTALGVAGASVSAFAASRLESAQLAFDLIRVVQDQIASAAAALSWAPLATLAIIAALGLPALMRSIVDPP